MENSTILIVDDDVEICSTMKDIMTELGSRVMIAHTGEEALKKADLMPFNLVMIDMVLPDSNGITLMKELKKRDPELICVIITGNASLHNSIQALNEGAHSYFLKPLDINKLLAEISTHLETQSLRQSQKAFNLKLEQEVKIKTKKLNEALNQSKLYQEQLLKSSQFKSEFMAHMSHELRTPLNSILGFTDVILEKISGEINEEQERFLTNVKSSALHLLDLINDILDIAKIESGKVELNISEVKLAPLIKQINTMIKPIYEKKHLEILFPQIDEETVIYVDRLRLKEILFNLLSNAVKYTLKGQICLEFSEEVHCWKFSVMDTGIGIKEEDFKLIFQDFKRIQSARVAAIEGTGLGLSLTKRLIEYHGGNISFTSMIGKGSTFTFTIPKSDLTPI